MKERQEDHEMPPRRSSVLASVLAAGFMLAVAACSHITPLGPTPQAHPAAPVAAPAVAVPPQRLRAPIVLQAVLVQKPTAAGSCPAGYASLSGGTPGCYRKTGTPVTFTSAAISSAVQSGLAPGQPNGQPGYGVLVSLPAIDAQALQIVTTTAYNANGAVAISVAGKVWSVQMALQPLTSGQLQISVSSKNQAAQLQSTLTSSH
jgi:hypothetical protein